MIPVSFISSLKMGILCVVFHYLLTMYALSVLVVLLSQAVLWEYSTEIIERK